MTTMQAIAVCCLVMAIPLALIVGFWWGCIHQVRSQERVVDKIVKDMGL